MAPPINQAAPARTRTILSILIDQGVITREQAALLPPAADNAAIEELLLSEHLVTEDEILRAYAAYYQIPYLRLIGLQVKPTTLKLIPEDTSRRYGIVAFDRDHDLIRVAIAKPRRFKAQERRGLLHRLQEELKVKIAPAFVPHEDIQAIQDQYHTEKIEQAEPTVPPTASKDSPKPMAPTSGPTPVAQSAPQPVSALGLPIAAPATAYEPTISLLDAVIPHEVLKKIPKEIAVKYQIIAFAEPTAGQLNIAAVRPDDPIIRRLLKYVEERNRVVVTLYATDEPSLTHALLEYDQAPVTAASLTPPPQSTELPAATPSVDGATNTVVLPNSANGTPEIKVEEISRVTDEFTPLQAEIYKQSKTPGPEAAQDEKERREKAQRQAENTIDTFIGHPINNLNDLVAIIKTGNIPKSVAAMIALAVVSRASDIHIEASKEQLRLRYRIDGELSDILLLPVSLLAPIVSRVKILSQMKIDENRIPQDGRFDVRYRGREIDLRISSLPTVHGEKVVMRILDKTTGIYTLEAMGLEGENFKRLTTNIEKPYGIILSTGPTGSGKSTTLYAILQKISQPNVNVVTLEDPVEYEIKGVNQTQIKPKIGFTFADGLRSILRQDPNIIMVGEIRDRETAEMATHAALTGHLVLSTLHTNTAAGALPRLINMGIEPFLITSSINAIIGQRLVRRVCPDCKTVDSVPEATIEEIKKELLDSNVPAEFKDPTKWQFSIGKGCPNCSNGYKGRIGIFEVLPMSATIEDLAVKKEPATAIEQQALKEGMITMKQDGLIKALQGTTSLEEVLKATTE